VAVSGRVRDGEPAFYRVVVWRAQAEHAAESLAKGSRVVVVGRLQQRSWQADDGTTRSLVEVVADELGPSLGWATATTTKATKSPSSYYGDSQGVRLVRRLTCTNAKLASLHLIAPVISARRGQKFCL
jgi:single-strand DNA-binding protein